MFCLIGQLCIDVCRYQSNHKPNCKYCKRETKLDIPEVNHNHATAKNHANDRSQIHNKPHDSYLQQIVYFVFHCTYYTISFYILSSPIFKFNKKIFIPDFPFVFVIIILIVNILYLYRNNYHLCFVKNKSREFSSRLKIILLV